MSTLWTPDGERPIRRAEQQGSSPTGGDPNSASTASASPLPGSDDAALAAEAQRLEEQLAQAPVEMVVANHAIALFQLAGLHLSPQPPRLDQARLAIDAVAALVEGLAGRLGPDEASLQDALAQLRMAYVQIANAHAAGSPGSGPPAAGEGAAG